MVERKQVDEKYCSDCGAIMKTKAQICVKCGVAQQEITCDKPKNKTTAVLLAVFFGAFSFLYTWKQDSTKFWVCLALNLILWWTIVVPIGVWIYAMVVQGSRDF